jgi:hypothetical protein
MTEENNLFRKDSATFSSDDLKVVIDIYKTLIDMADKVSQRRQSANNFYLSVNTAIIGASAYINAIGQSALNIFLIAIAGIGVCLVWQRNISSYKTLNEAKFKVINELENGLPVAPYTREWTHLDPDQNGTRHTPFHAVEVWVPRIFVALHVAQGLRVVPWGQIVTLPCLTAVR